MVRRVSSFERMAELAAEHLADDLPLSPHMLSWTEQQAVAYFESGGLDPPPPPAYPRVWLTSDVHTDREENMAWLQGLARHEGQAVIVAGDVSHQMEQLHQSLSVLSRRFEHVFFTPGNHDLWISRADGPMDSLAKLDAIERMCERLGNVHTAPRLLRADGSCSGEGAGLWVVPLVSWYDDSLDLTSLAPQVADRALDMCSFTWSDFALCKWPAHLLEPGDTITGMYPAGVAAELARRNEPSISKVNTALRRGVGDAVLSFSHFLPREETLPDWLVPSCPNFRNEWLDHPASNTAVKFSRVAGSRRIEQQLRQLSDGVCAPQDATGSFEGRLVGVPPGRCHHLHAFGHSHRPKDFTLDGVRYLSHPLGYSKERDKQLTPALPHLRLIWDVDGPTLPPPKPLIRYWEENGGAEPNLDAILSSSVRGSALSGPCGGSRSLKMRRNVTWTCGADGHASMEAAAAAADELSRRVHPELAEGASPMRSASAVRSERRRQMIEAQRTRAQHFAATDARRVGECWRTQSLGALHSEANVAGDGDDIADLLG